MRRHCDGNDPNLVMRVDPTSGDRLDDIKRTHLDKPCDCGRIFDDVRRSTVYPHEPI